MDQRAPFNPVRDDDEDEELSFDEWDGEEQQEDEPRPDTEPPSFYDPYQHFQPGAGGRRHRGRSKDVRQDKDADDDLAGDGDGDGRRAWLCAATSRSRC